LAVATALASDYLAFSPLKEDRAFQARLPGDPRLEPRYRGYNALYRLRPAEERFVLDWRVVPAGTPLPVPAERAVAGWPAYPRLADLQARRYEGWVDADRILGGRGDCLALVRDWEEAPGVGAPDRGPIRWELAPWGPTTLWVDGEPAVRMAGELRSVLGRGVLLAPRLEPGPHRMTVLTCRAGSGGEGDRAGFYLLRREGSP
jgi:hypothetical protein